MTIKEIYNFSPFDFDGNGKRVSDGIPFRDVLKEFEFDFHDCHLNYYALYMFANQSTMLLLSRSCNARKNLIYGMDLVESEFDPTTNFCIEEASSMEYVIVYGIDSAFMLCDDQGIARIDEDKKLYPLTLLVDENMRDGVLYLKYLDDDRENDDDYVTEPVAIDNYIFTE